MDASAWIEEFATRLGAEAPSQREVDALLDLAGVAAHGSQRTAAPIACYLIGRTGVDLDRAMELARGVEAR